MDPSLRAFMYRILSLSVVTCCHHIHQFGKNGRWDGKWLPTEQEMGLLLKMAHLPPPGKMWRRDNCVGQHGYEDVSIHEELCTLSREWRASTDILSWHPSLYFDLTSAIYTQGEGKARTSWNPTLHNFCYTNFPAANLITEHTPLWNS